MENRNCIITVRVHCGEAISVNGKSCIKVMIPFTCTADGPLFNGSSTGSCVDTQTVSKDGKALLSARYMLDGTDCDGNRCRVFIQNEGSFEDGFHPSIVTDSPALSYLETSQLTASAEISGDEVRIYIYAD